MSNHNVFTSISDPYGRVPAYLRLSITDRCNLACVYCRDKRRATFIPHERILRYEQIFSLCQSMVNMGIGKVRITGGEPFARRGCITFLKKLREVFPRIRLSVTTNATLVEPWLDELADLGLQSINISLDSFQKETFAQITGQNLLDTVLRNIDGLLTRKVRVKLNAVALKGITDSQMDDFIHAARHMPVDMRFIEFMPMGDNTIWSPDNFLSCEILKNNLRERITLRAALPEDGKYAGPARIYTFAGARGRLGFITALSDHFCHSCNRLRITSDGLLRTCLFSDVEYPLAHLLDMETDERLRRTVAEACCQKPLGENILRVRRQKAVAQKNMDGIGG